MKKCVGQIIGCANCKEEFQSGRELKEHKSETKHGNKKCLQCGRRFACNISRHVKIEHELRRFECSSCKSRFKSKNGIEGHAVTALKLVASTMPLFNEVVTQEEKSDANSVRCGECNIEFYRKFNLKRHLKTHHVKQRKEKICSVCGKEFPRPVTLKRHMKCHDPENKPFSCSECNSRFTEKKRLVGHMRVVHAKTSSE